MSRDPLLAQTLTWTKSRNSLRLAFSKPSHSDSIVSPYCLLILAGTHPSCDGSNLCFQHSVALVWICYTVAQCLPLKCIIISSNAWKSTEFSDIISNSRCTFIKICLHCCFYCEAKVNRSSQFSLLSLSVTIRVSVKFSFSIFVSTWHIKWILRFNSL